MKNFHKSLKNGRERIKKVYTKTTDKIKDAQQGFAGYVKKHPWKAVGLSALAGALLTRIRRK